MPTTAARRATDPAHRRSPAAQRELLPALLVLLTVWSLLATQAWLGPRIGRPAAVALSFIAATALVIATRERESEPAPARALALGAVGALTGFVSFPAWILLIALIGIALGLEPVPPPPRPGDTLLLVSVLGFGPVFEELLYRERLLLALRERVGAGFALALSSVCFALPHLEPWAMLATSIVGLGLGTLMLARRSVALCIGLHAGLNLAAVVCGIPPARFALPGALAAVASAVILGAGLIATRVRRFGSVATDGH